MNPNNPDDGKLSILGSAATCALLSALVTGCAWHVARPADLSRVRRPDREPLAPPPRHMPPRSNDAARPGGPVARTDLNSPRPPPSPASPNTEAQTERVTLARLDEAESLARIMRRTGAEASVEAAGPEGDRRYIVHIRRIDKRPTRAPTAADNTNTRAAAGSRDTERPHDERRRAPQPAEKRTPPPDSDDITEASSPIEEPPRQQRRRRKHEPLVHIELLGPPLPDDNSGAI